VEGYGDDGAEFMAVFTHGELESLDPILEEVSAAYRQLGRGVSTLREAERPTPASLARREAVTLRHACCAFEPRP